ncbi:MAG: precorrin-6A/cobalt-precorrin-6A reductase [Pseudomonadota bacterium]
MKRILVLAGTAEARALCGLLATIPEVAATASLAGATAAPMAYPVPVVSGGFGGAEGLARWLRTHRISALIDATHPFATSMHAHATRAAESAGVPFLKLDRPGWRAGAGDRWVRHADLDALLDALPGGSHVFAALGARAAPYLGRRPDVRFLLRAIEQPGCVPDNVRVLRARAPAEPEAERALIAAEGITLLAARDAGGEAGRAKLAAARALGLQVHLLNRPWNQPLGPGGTDRVPTARLAADWVCRALATRSEDGLS